MRELPIPFTGESVRDILAGTKVQTRRVVKRQPSPTARFYKQDSMGAFGWSDNTWKRCPFGGPGDLLWVRETHAIVECKAGEDGAVDVSRRGIYSAKGERFDHAKIAYAADEGQIHWEPPTWRPWLYMPRWASRLLLEVVEVRVQRVQEIDARDIEAEGVVIPGTLNDGVVAEYRSAFASAWDAINGSRRVREYDGEMGSRTYGGMKSRLDTSHSWAANPWVWAITFRRVDVTTPATVNGEGLERRG